MAQTILKMMLVTSALASGLASPLAALPTAALPLAHSDAPMVSCLTSPGPARLAQEGPGRRPFPRSATDVELPVNDARNIAFDDTDYMVGPGPCCPPFWEGRIPDALNPQFQGAANGPFTLSYSAPANLDAQMEAYTAYVHAMYPGITQISLNWILADLGTAATHSWAGPPLAPPQTTAWTATSAIGGGFWAGFPLVPNHWYGVRTVLSHNGREREAPWMEGCTVNQLFVRWSVSPAIMLSGSGGGRFEAMAGNGKAVRFGQSSQR